LKIGARATFAGSKRSQGGLDGLVASVRRTIEGLSVEARLAAGTSGQSLEESVGRLALPKLRIIVVFANPDGVGKLRWELEERAIRQAIERGKARDSVAVKFRHATTVDDLRRALLDDGYQMLQFPGHGEFDALLFEDDRKKVIKSPLGSLVSLIDHHLSIKCVLLNACNSITALDQPIAEVTIGR
jgi:hypothetical protein